MDEAGSNDLINGQPEEGAAHAFWSMSRALFPCGVNTRGGRYGTQIGREVASTPVPVAVIFIAVPPFAG